MTSLLQVQDLRVSVRGREVVRGLSFDVAAGETLAVVGESGAGKSVTARAVLGLLPAGLSVSGSIRFDEHELVGATPALRRELWGRRMAFVPQDALSVLSPVHPIGDQLALAVRSVRKVSRKAAWEHAVAALDRVGIPDAAGRARAYPHEFSGGMRQRAVIAMATINDPALVIADEPTSALDPIVQRRVMESLEHLREQTGMALVLVTHDLGVAGAHADRILVMYAGGHVESGSAQHVLAHPQAPYTAGLVASLPREAVRRLPSIGGTPPTPATLPAGCAFAPRCPAAAQPCGEQAPEPRVVGHGHLTSCHRIEDLPVPVTRLYEETSA